GPAWDDRQASQARGSTLAWGPGGGSSAGRAPALQARDTTPRVRVSGAVAPLPLVDHGRRCPPLRPVAGGPAPDRGRGPGGAPQALVEAVWRAVEQLDLRRVANR